MIVVGVGGVCGNRRCQPNEENGSQRKNHDTIQFFSEIRFFIRRNINNPPFHLFHISARLSGEKSCRKWKRHTGYFFGKADQGIAVFFVIMVQGASGKLIN